MASYSATVPSPRPPDEVFAYLADFRSVAEWDPSITESIHVNGDDPVKVGAIFRVSTETMLSNVVLEYTTIELDRPRKIVLRGENDSMVSIDTIVIHDDGHGGTEVTYGAEIELKGVRKLADPLLQFGFKRLGDKARDGLETKLNPAA
ncbi:MAG: SRPBCC family protein [Solirubrobacteraceae bacterium]